LSGSFAKEDPKLPLRISNSAFVPKVFLQCQLLPAEQGLCYPQKPSISTSISREKARTLRRQRARPVLHQVATRGFGPSIIHSLWRIPTASLPMVCQRRGSRLLPQVDAKIVNGRFVNTTRPEKRPCQNARHKDWGSLPTICLL
jgi:hypothetical protein